MCGAKGTSNMGIPQQNFTRIKGTPTWSNRRHWQLRHSRLWRLLWFFCHEGWRVTIQWHARISQAHHLPFPAPCRISSSPVVPGDFNRSRSLATSISLEAHVQIGSLTAAKPLVSPQVSENLNLNGKKLWENHRKPARPKGIPKVFERFFLPRNWRNSWFYWWFYCCPKALPPPVADCPSRARSSALPGPSPRAWKRTAPRRTASAGCHVRSEIGKSWWGSMFFIYYGLRIYVNICVMIYDDGLWQLMMICVMVRIAFSMTVCAVRGSKSICQFAFTIGKWRVLFLILGAHQVMFLLLQWTKLLRHSW